MWIKGLLFGVVCGNVLFAMSVFILLGKPKIFFGMLVRLLGREADWRYGMLSTHDEENIFNFRRRLGQYGLLVLLLWSFLSGLCLRLWVL